MGGSKTTKTTIPQWMEDSARSGLARSDAVSRIPHVPYYGPDVAAMTPMQNSAMQSTSQAASEFGMPSSGVGAGAPPAMDYGGVAAHSSGQLYDQAIAELKRRQPGTYNAIFSQFSDPITGILPPTKIIPPDVKPSKKMRGKK